MKFNLSEGIVFRDINQLKEFHLKMIVIWFGLRKEHFKGVHFIIQLFNVALRFLEFNGARSESGGYAKACPSLSNLNLIMGTSLT